MNLKRFVLTLFNFAGMACVAMAGTQVREFDVGGNPELELTNISGDIKVVQGAGDRINVTFEKRDDRIEVEFEQVGDSVRVRTIYPDNVRNTRGGVYFTVEFPAEGQLLLTSVSGAIDVNGIFGTHRLKSVSGHVRVANLEGELDLNSVSGNVEMTRLGIAEVEATSISGDVVYREGDLLGGDYNFSSTSGSIRLNHGPAASYDISGRTLSGNIRNKIGNELEVIKAKYGPNTRLEGSVNGGTVRVRANSISGGITIEYQ